MSLDRDWQIRLAAMAKLEELRRAGDGLVRAAELTAGFQFEGERIPFWNSQRGIFRPVQLQDLGVALSIRTAPLIEGVTPAYDDEVAADGKGWFGYKYEATDPDRWSNVAVQRAGELERPLIYLYGVAKGIYEPIFPVYVTNDDPAGLTFRVEAGAPFSVKSPESATLLMDAPMRAYQTVAVKRRLHQHRFRELVLGAYKRRCTMCNLGHTQLLDAAHIIPDHDDRGKPEFRMGSRCARSITQRTTCTSLASRQILSCTCARISSERSTDRCWSMG